MSLRAVFFDEADARTAAGRLRGNGFEAVLSRDRLAGEDDDEDHPWQVETDAPAVMVELLVEELDGWFDDEPPDPPTAPLPPLDLPDAPRRIKGHFGPG